LSEADFEQLAQDGVPMIEMDKGADLMQALVDSDCNLLAVRRVRPLRLTR
jgi:hypothetical protein